MNILFICENYLPHYGGAEVVFQNLAERYVKKGHGVTLLTHRLRGTEKEEIINGVNVVRLDSFFSRYFFTFLALPRALRLAQHHDVIQTTTFNGAPPAWIAGRIRRKPVVITVHEVWQGRWKQITGFSWLKSMLHELLERAIYFLPYDLYVCVSEATKKDLLSLGVPEKKVKRIYNGLDYAFWNPAKVSKEKVRTLRKQLQLDKKYVFFSWGRPGPSKGFEYLVVALPRILQDLPDAHFVFMFSKVLMHEQRRQKLLAALHRPELKDKVTVLQSIPYAELRNYVALADCVIVPSASEGFGYNAVEAMAMHKAVLVSDAGSLPEVVGGRFQTFASQSSQDLAEKAILLAKGKCLRKQPKTFPWEESITAYLNEYQQLLQRHQARH